jgi:hypothetical protein
MSDPVEGAPGSPSSRRVHHHRQYQAIADREPCWRQTSAQYRQNLRDRGERNAISGLCDLFRYERA